MDKFQNLDAEFKLLDFNLSHSQMLLRSLKNKNRDYNIDIHFKGVSFLLIPKSFNGIEISLCNSNSDKEFLITTYGFTETLGSKIFSLKDSNSKEYFVNAFIFAVFHNKLDILETSIGRYDWGHLGEKIL